MTIPRQQAGVSAEAVVKLVEKWVHAAAELRNSALLLSSRETYRRALLNTEADTYDHNAAELEATLLATAPPEQAAQLEPSWAKRHGLTTRAEKE